MSVPSRVRELLRYEPETGLFFWLVNRRGHAKSGDVAGCVDSDGYVLVKVCGVLFKAHRLAWWFVHGEMPIGEMDHVNRERADNRIANLRVATRRQNCWNSGGRRTKTGDGPKGVSFDKTRGKYLVRITIDGKLRNIGRFDTVERASEAYREAARRAYGEFAPA